VGGAVIVKFWEWRGPPRFLLYAQAVQADGATMRNVLIATEPGVFANRTLDTINRALEPLLRNAREEFAQVAQSHGGGRLPPSPGRVDPRLDSPAGEFRAEHHRRGAASGRHPRSILSSSWTHVSHMTAPHPRSLKFRA
jgi:hypothetical protein